VARKRKTSLQWFQILKEEAHNESVIAIGRMLRSTTWESISMRPSSVKRQRLVPAGERIADRLGELAFLTDAIEFFAQPHHKAVKIRRLFSWRSVPGWRR